MPMKIYVILSFDGESLENVYVGPDEEKALALNRPTLKIVMLYS